MNHMDTLILHEMYFMNFKYYWHDLTCENKSIIVFEPIALVCINSKDIEIDKGIFIRKSKWIYA